MCVYQLGMYRLDQLSNNGGDDDNDRFGIKEDEILNTNSKNNGISGLFLVFLRFLKNEVSTP